MFFLKKLISAVLLPLNLGLGLLLTGLILLWATSRLRAGKILVTAGALLLVLVSYNPAVDLWHDPLEARYPFLSAQDLADLAAGKRGAPLRWVVVLGGGLTEAPGVPAPSRLSETSLARLVEGVRLVRELPQATLLFSVGEANEPEVLAGLVVSLGVPRDRLVMESQTRDTGDQARTLAPLLGRDAFILVTSAVHLPRAVALFRGQGLDPIPQPAGYLGRGRGEFGIFRFLPNSFGMVRSERAWHEYLGLAWSWLAGGHK